MSSIDKMKPLDDKKTTIITQPAIWRVMVYLYYVTIFHQLIFSGE